MFNDYTHDAKSVISVERYPSQNNSNIYSLAGDNQVIPTPGLHRRIVVTSYVIQNESGNPLTMILRSGTTNNGWRTLAQKVVQLV